MSLLEVLISIFVLLIGLLGVAAVIPVGGHEILQAVKADRAATIGPAVLEDMKVRGMLNPGNWRDANGSALGMRNPFYSMTRPYISPPRRGYPFGESYVIDSLYMATTPAGQRPNINDFPYNARNPGTRVVPGWPGTWTRLQRVTWTGVGFNQALARALHMWRDDLVIPVPDDDTARPELLMVFDNASNPLYGENAGDYTYMVTVSPATETVDFAVGSAAPYTYPENIPQYEVSVVVFYKRDMSRPSGGTSDDPPAERQVALAFLGSGLGGGDVLLSLLPGDGRNRLPYLDVKENEWLMVSGGYVGSAPYRNFASVPDIAGRPVGVHKWYRILAVGESVIEDANWNGVLDRDEDLNGNGQLDPPYREVTLAGPDWNIGIWNNDIVPYPALDGVPDFPYFATLLKGAVGVYTKTVEFDW